MERRPEAFYRFLRKERYARLATIPLATFLISGARGVLIPDQEQSYWIALAYTAIIWNGIAYVHGLLTSRYPSIEQTSYRIAALVAFIAAYSFAVNALGNFVEFCAGSEGEILLRDWLLAFMIALIVTSVYEFINFFYLWKEAIQESDRLKLAKAQTEFQALREQVNPHFLFNSLNALASLIPEDPEMAVRFTQKLSEVYRYVLQSKNHDLVTLETELSFVRSYLFLLSIRHGESVQAEIDVDDAYLGASLPPLALQMLVENAVKHNVVSASRPLRLRIYADGERIVVRNNRQPKLTDSAGTGAGLDNIARRYYHLVKKEIKVVEGEGEFVVTLPLIEVGRHEASQSRKTEAA